MALVGLQIVMPVAEPHQVAKGGGPAIAERLDMIDLECVIDSTPWDHADRITFDEGSSDRCGDSATGVSDRGHVHALGDQDAQDRIDGQTAGDLHRYRPDSGTLLSVVKPLGDVESENSGQISEEPLDLEGKLLLSHAFGLVRCPEPRFGESPESQPVRVTNLARARSATRDSGAR